MGFIVAQRPIEITVQIDQPYPLLINDYVEIFDIYTLTIWNHTFVDQEIVLGMEMLGKNGVRIATKPGYRSNPISLLQINDEISKVFYHALPFAFLPNIC